MIFKYNNTLNFKVIFTNSDKKVYTFKQIIPPQIFTIFLTYNYKIHIYQYT